MESILDYVYTLQRKLAFLSTLLMYIVSICAFKVTYAFIYMLIIRGM